MIYILKLSTFTKLWLSAFMLTASLGDLSSGTSPLAALVAESPTNLSR